MLPVGLFTNYIKQHALFAEGEKVLLAVSGGKDSVVMAHLFKQANYAFGIAHCNFNLRAGEAQRDENFVRQLCDTLNVPFFLKQFNTLEFAEEHAISTQMAARQLRYMWFETLRNAEGFHKIALAHHQNDVVETVLLNLVRGTGLSGLHGILPATGKLIRPLLFLTADDIKAIVEENNIAFVEDSSNQSTKYTRNKLRLKVIPELRTINPSLEQTFIQNIQHFAAAEEIVQQVVAALRKDICRSNPSGITMDITAIRALKPQRLLLFELLKPYHFSGTLIDEILNALDKQSGTSFYSPSHRATINREHLLVTSLPKDADYTLQWHAGTQRIRMNATEISATTADQVPQHFKPDCAYIDVDKLIFPLALRYWQSGDKFIPLGMNRFKKLSDFFIDLKIPLPEKAHIPLLLNGNGQIIWIGGLRQDERYKITSATKKVIIFGLEK